MRVEGITSAMFTKVESDTLRERIRQETINLNLQVKALIQDIGFINGPLELLSDLNAEGREKLASLKKNIDELESLAKETSSALERIDFDNEVQCYRQQFISSMTAFRQANIQAMLRISKAAKDELLSQNSKEDNVKLRQRKDKAGLVKLSTNITDHLLSLSRNLADTTQRSAETLETLANSSTSVHGTQEELLTTSGVIQQSGTLLAKYGRRELTDKVLLFFGFGFFFTCVLYIVHKRLF